MRNLSKNCSIQRSSCHICHPMRHTLIHEPSRLLSSTKRIKMTEESQHLRGAQLKPEQSAVNTEDYSGTYGQFLHQTKRVSTHFSHSDCLIVKDFKFTLLLLHSFIYKRGELWKRERIRPSILPFPKHKVTKAKNDLPEERAPPY